MRDVEQAAEAWRAGVFSNESVALGATFCGCARPEQTSAPLMSFPAYVKVNRTSAQSNCQVSLVFSQTLLLSVEPLDLAYILKYNKGEEDIRSSRGRIG